MAAIIWNRKDRIIVGGVFPDTSSANQHVTRVQKTDGRTGQPAKTYDVITVSVQ
jgi:hypothetical protein